MQKTRGAGRRYAHVMQLGIVGARRAVCVDRNQSVEAASFAMRLQKVDQVVVTERGADTNVPIGILSANDIVTRVVAVGLDCSVVTAGRSEERRVGKECRARWSPERRKR